MTTTNISHNTVTNVQDTFITLADEFIFDENCKILFWCVRKDTEKFLRLANFEIRIKRRFKIITPNGSSNMLTLVLHSYQDSEITIPLSELSFLMKNIEKQYPQYRLYPDSKNQKELFKQYVSETYEKIVSNYIEEIVYQNAGWHLTENNYWRYYSGNDVGYCFSNFRLSNNVCFLVRELISWAEGLLNMGADEIMIPLLLHAHLGYTLHLFEMAGYQEQYILALIGASGSKKTSVARVMFSLFGEALINFTSTDRAIELAMMNRQDSTLILDDLTSGNNKDLTGKFERILRQLGDSTGRVKSINGGMAQESVRTRCAILLTAETDIDALSKSSKLRTLSVPVGINSFNSEILSIYQQEAEQSKMLGRASKLEQYMTFYIDHLQRNYREIVNFLHAARCTIQPNDLTFARQATIFKMLKSQAIIILDFWIRHSMISQEEIIVVSERFLNAITKIMMMNEQRCIEFEPYILFLKAIKEGTFGLIANSKDRLCYDSRYIGYWHNEYLMLRAELAYNYVVQFYSLRGKFFSESLMTILNKLYELNLIAVYEQKDHKPKLLKQVKINNISQNMICLKWIVVESLLNNLTQHI